MATTERAVPSRSPSQAPSRAPLHREGWVTRNLRTIGMVWQREMIRFIRMPSRIVSGLAQPVLFLFVLGAGIKPLVDVTRAASTTRSSSSPA